MKTGGTMNFLKRAGAILMVVAIFASSCNKYADDFKQLNTKLDALASTVAGLPQLATDLAATKASVATLTSAIAALPTSASVTALATSLTTISGKVDAIGTTLASVATQGTANATAIAGVKSDLAALVASQATANAAATAAFAADLAKMTALDTKVSDAVAKLVAIAAQETALGTAVAANAAQITALGTSVTALTAAEAAGFAANAASLAALAAQASTLATSVASLTTADAAGFAAAATANAALATQAATIITNLTADTTANAATALVIAGLKTSLDAANAAIATVLLNQVSPLTAVTIDNVSPQVGSVLTALPVTALGATTNATYQWYVGGTAVAGATAKTYTVMLADLAKTVVVKATGTGNALSTEKASAATAIVSPQTPLTGVSISYGIAALCPTVAQVGGLMYASGITPTTTAVTYQWQSSTTAGGTYTNIAGATSSKYYPVTADATMFIRVSITGTGAFTGTVNSAPSAAVIYPVAITGVGSLVGVVPQVNVALTAPATTLYRQPTTTGSPSEVSIGNPYTANYQWQSSADGGTTWVDLAGAVAATYTPASTDLGNILRVKAIGKAFLYGTVVSLASSPVVYPQAITAMAVPTGTVAYGSTLTVGATTPATTQGVGATYQWMSAGVAIFGATGSTYALQASDVGNAITVVATGQNGFFGTVTSTATGAVAMAPVNTPAFTTVAGSNNITINLTGGTFVLAPTFTFGGANAAALAGATVNRVSTTQVVLTTAGALVAAADNYVVISTGAMLTQVGSAAAVANTVAAVVSAPITPTVGQKTLNVTLTGGSFKPTATLGIGDFSFATFAFADLALLGAGSVSRTDATHAVITIGGAGFTATTAGTVTIPAQTQMTQATSVAGVTAP